MEIDPTVHTCLHLNEIDFPNATLNIFWYSGIESITKLEFNRCQLSLIEDNAFNADVFEKLEYLKFVHMKLLDLQMGFFNPLRGLEFHHTRLVTIPDNFLTPHQKSLNSFYMMDFPLNTNLNELFGYLRLSQLRAVQLYGIYGHDDVSRSLQASNFTRLPSIDILALVNFGIEQIDPKTFDFIGETLTMLDLTCNKLKTIQTRWFAIFLDTNRRDKSYKLLWYKFNPMECNCDFYEVRNFTIYLKHFHNMHEEHEYSMRPHCEIGRETKHNLKCDNLQTMRKEKIYFNESAITTYSYPRVDIRVRVRSDDSTLIVRTKFRSNYRVLIQNRRTMEKRKRSKCPSPQWIRHSITCFVFSHEVKSIPVHEYLNKTLLTTIFVILTEPNKRVWPMHIQTINAQMLVHETMQNFVILLGAIGGWCGIFIAIILIYYWDRRKKRVVLKDFIEVEDPTHVIGYVFTIT